MGSIERFTLTEIDWPEFLFHMQRYSISANYSVGKKVLDCPCGEGYGAAYIATNAQHITGVDISKDAVDICREKYSDIKNLDFIVGEMESLPLDDRSFDIINCFEGIEHVGDAEQDLAIANFHRMLKPDGIFLISTPDRDVGLERNYHNPFHIHEMSKNEFEAKLKKHFKNVRLYSQEINMASAMWSMGNDEDYTKSDLKNMANINQVEIGSDGIIKNSHGNRDFYYMFAICSNVSIPFPESDYFSSYNREPAFALWNKIDAGNNETAKAKDELITARQELDKANIKLLELNNQIIENENHIAEITKNYDDIWQTLSAEKHKHSNKKSEIAELEKELFEKEKYIAEYEKKQEELLNALNAEKQKLDQKENEIDKLKKELFEKENYVDEVKKNYDDIWQTLSAEKQKLAQKDSEIDDINKKFSTLEANYKKLQSADKRKIEENAILQKSLSQLTTHYSEEIDALSNRYNAAIESHNKELAALNDKHQDDVILLTEEIIILQKNLSQLTEHYAEEINTLKTKHREALEKNNEEMASILNSNKVIASELLALRASHDTLISEYDTRVHERNMASLELAEKTRFYNSRIGRFARVYYKIYEVPILGLPFKILRKIAAIIKSIIRPNKVN